MTCQYNEGAPQCPACGHAMTTDEMLNHEGEDLFALAPNEKTTEIECPACGETFHCQGGYRPTYTTAFNEDDQP